MKHAWICCLAALSSPVCAADELGRLFFTQEQRAILDHARRTQPQASQDNEASYEGVTLSGIVTRSDGKRTVWVNGQPQAITPNGSTASAVIPLPSGEGKVRLKVGQTLDAASGAVQEGYRRTPAETATAAPAPNMPARKPASPKPTDKNDDASAEDAADPVR